MTVTVLTPTFNRGGGGITKPLGFAAKANCKRF